MEKMLQKHVDVLAGRVIDVGSAQIGNSETYKKFFDGWEYFGVDVDQKDNVDVVMTGEYEIPLPDNFADLLITGQCIEHVRNPFKLMAEAVRCLKTGGYVICIAPNRDSIHRYPIDTFRYHPDGMEAIFDEAGVTKIVCELGDKSQRIIDCYFVGVKQ